MIYLKDIEDKFDLKKVMLNDNPDIFYNLKINLINKDRIDSKKLSLVEYLAEIIEEIKPKVKCINLYIPYEKISKEDFEPFYNLYQNTKDEIPCSVYVVHRYKDDEIFFYEEETINWELKTIIKANFEIDKVCQFIKDMNFSPLEALAYIHNYVSNIAEYRVSNPSKLSWHDADQFFVGAYKDLPEVVCAGYSSLMKEIIDNLNMPELECELVSVEFKHLKKDYSARHARCFIRIKDDKYGIDQTMFDDPTWDNDIKSNCLKYAHFAMPNDCHDRKRNNNYQYFSIYQFNYPNEKAFSEIIDFNECTNFKNNSRNQIDQKMIETAFVNIMHKTCPKQEPNEIYNALKQLSQQSYKEQIERYFLGNLKQPNPVLKRKDIYEICGKTKQEKLIDEL